MAQTILCLFFVAAIPYAASAAQWQVCPQDRIDLFMEVPQPYACAHVHNDHPLQHVKVTVYTPQQEPMSTEAHKCVVVLDKQCTYMDIFGSTNTHKNVC
jgi:hypothetical protein